MQSQVKKQLKVDKQYAAIDLGGFKSQVQAFKLKTLGITEQEDDDVDNGLSYEMLSYEIHNANASQYSSSHNDRGQKIVKHSSSRKGLRETQIFTEKDRELIALISEFIAKEYRKSDFMLDLQRYIRHYDQQQP